MTGRARISLVAFLFAGACARPSSPVTAPEPANDSVSPAVPAAMEVLEKESKSASPAAARPKPAAASPKPTPAPPKPTPTPPPAPAPTPVIPTPHRESGGSVEPTYEVLKLPGPKRAPEASWDIEVKEYLSHDRVDFYVRRFTGSHRPTINMWMQRGLRYEPMIRKTFRAGRHSGRHVLPRPRREWIRPARVFARGRCRDVAVHDRHGARRRVARGLVGGRAT